MKKLQFFVSPKMTLDMQSAFVIKDPHLDPRKGEHLKWGMS